MQYDDVWAIIHEGCNSCSHNRARRQHAVAKMKVSGLHPISLHKKATTFNGTGRSTKNENPNIPMGIILDAVSVSWSRVPLPDDLLFQSMRTRSLFIFFFSVEGLGSQWMTQTPHPSTSLDADEYYPMLERLCHAHIGVFMEAPLDEEETCNKDEVHRLDGHSNRYHCRYSDPFV